MARSNLLKKSKLTLVAHGQGLALDVNVWCLTVHDLGLLVELLHPPEHAVADNRLPVYRLLGCNTNCQ